MLDRCYAFTTKYDFITSRIITEAKIIYRGRIYYTMDAQWDTGATNTCISRKVVQELGLIPVGKQLIHTPAGQTVVNSYLVDIMLRNDLIVSNVRVNDSEIGGQGIDILIGMDIISLGDLAITNKNGKTTFTFQAPSVTEIDFARDMAIFNARMSQQNKAKEQP